MEIDDCTKLNDSFLCMGVYIHTYIQTYIPYVYTYVPYIHTYTFKRSSILIRILVLTLSLLATHIGVLYHAYVQANLCGKIFASKYALTKGLKINKEKTNNTDVCFIYTYTRIHTHTRIIYIYIHTYTYKK